MSYIKQYPLIQVRDDRNFIVSPGLEMRMGYDSNRHKCICCVYDEDSVMVEKVLWNGYSNGGCGSFKIEIYTPFQRASAIPEDLPANRKILLSVCQTSVGYLIVNPITVPKELYFIDPTLLDEETLKDMTVEVFSREQYQEHIDIFRGIDKEAFASLAVNYMFSGAWDYKVTNFKVERRGVMHYLTGELEPYEGVEMPDGPFLPTELFGFMTCSTLGSTFHQFPNFAISDTP